MNNDDLYLEQLLVGPMDNFIYLIGSKSTREVVIIDPAWDIDALLNHIKEKLTRKVFEIINCKLNDLCNLKW